MSDGLILADEAGIGANDIVMAKNMADALQKHYPGHLWAVTCDGKQGVATVRNMMLSGNWGVVIKLKTLNGDPSMRSVMRAGGEVLERYNLARANLNTERWAEVPRQAGRLIHVDD